MEHKLIQGGEQYLPFARSRIKALRATGLSHASQQFEIDGVSIKVRIAGDQEFINLNGEGVVPLSGVIKTGELITTPPVDAGGEPTYTLRKYRPTQNAWDYPLKKASAKSPAVFNDEARLANAATGTQYVDILPSMYSGLMAKAVQVYLGLGRIVGFKSSFATSHGIVKGADGALWLTEISGANGVLVTPLKVSRASATSKVDVVRHSALQFKGIPTDTAFLEGTPLADGILNGKVHRLLTSAEMADFFGKQAFSEDLGFSFGDTSAVNTCCDLTAGVHTSYLYRVNFSINRKEDIADLGIGSASLELLEQGAIDLKSSEYPPFFFESGGSVFAPAANSVAGYAVDAEYPVLAFYRDNVLEIVRVKNQAALTINTSYGYPVDGNTTVSITWGTHEKNVSEGQYIKSSSMLTDDMLTYEAVMNASQSVAADAGYFHGGGGRKVYSLRSTSAGWSANRESTRRGFWGKSERDGFAYFTGTVQLNTSHTDHAYVGLNDSPAGLSPGVYVVQDYDSVAFNITGTGSPWTVNYYVSTVGDLPAPIDSGATHVVTGAYADALAVAYAHLNSGNYDTRAYVSGVSSGLNEFGTTDTQWFPASVNPNIYDETSTVTYPGVRFAHASGNESGFANYDPVSAGEADYMWKRLDYGPPLKFACSMFGPRPHHYHVDLTDGKLNVSDPLGERKVLTGDLFSGETSAETDPYNFIGYI